MCIFNTALHDQIKVNVFIMASKMGIEKEKNVINSV